MNFCTRQSGSPCLRTACTSHSPPSGNHGRGGGHSILSTFFWFDSYTHDIRAAMF